MDRQGRPAHSRDQPDMEYPEPQRRHVLATRPGDYLARHQIHRRPGDGARAIAAAETKSVGMGRIIYVPDSYAFSNDTLRTTDETPCGSHRASPTGVAPRYSMNTIMALP